MPLLRFTVALLAVLFAIAPTRSSEQSSIPHHVKTYLYYGAGYINDKLPAAYIAAHADFVESTTSFLTSLVPQFKAAGGRYTVIYTDPVYMPYCVPPFTPPAGACKGPIGNTPGLPESAWLHDVTGTRLHRPDGYTHEYQEVLNPASPEARAAVRAYTSDIVAQSHGKVDLFFADDSGGPFRGPDSTPMSGRFYRFNAPATEITDDRSWLLSTQQLLASLARPVIINGVDNDQQPAFEGALLDGPNVVGDNIEGCFVNMFFPRPLSDVRSRWQNMANGLLAITRHHRYAVCMMQGKGLADPLQRLYGLASWWMTYDPDWSVIAPIDVASDGFAVFSEDEIVPTQPLKAISGVDDLRVGRSTYAREFARCYEDGRPIGRCAAVANISENATVPLPHLTQTYRKSLMVSSKSSYGGGTNTWTTMPASLGPLQGAILLGP